MPPFRNVNLSAMKSVKWPPTNMAIKEPMMEAMNVKPDCQVSNPYIAENAVEKLAEMITIVPMVTELISVASRTPLEEQARRLVAQQA